MCGSVLLAISSLLFLVHHGGVVDCGFLRLIAILLLAMIAHVPILVQPVGIPVAIATNFLATVPFNSKVSSHVVLPARVLRALRDGYTGNLPSPPDLEVDTDGETIESDHSLSECGSVRVTSTKRSSHGVLGVISKKDSVACEFFNISKDDDFSSHISGTDDSWCDEQRSGEATLGLPPVPAFPRSGDCARCTSDVVGINECTTQLENISWSVPSTGKRKSPMELLSTDAPSTVDEFNKVDVLAESLDAQNQIDLKQMPVVPSFPILEEKIVDNEPTEVDNYLRESDFA